MPGKFVEEIHIFKCGKHTDGSAIFCSELGWAKIPFILSEEASPNLVGWQEVGKTDIHIPLTTLVDVMKRFGITVSYDQKELALRLGSPPPTEY